MYFPPKRKRSIHFYCNSISNVVSWIDSSNVEDWISAIGADCEYFLGVSAQLYIFVVENLEKLVAGMGGKTPDSALEIMLSVDTAKRTAHCAVSFHTNLVVTQLEIEIAAVLTLAIDYLIFALKSIIFVSAWTQAIYDGAVHQFSLLEVFFNEAACGILEGRRGGCFELFLFVAVLAGIAEDSHSCATGIDLHFDLLVVGAEEEVGVVEVVWCEIQGDCVDMGGIGVVLHCYCE